MYFNEADSGAERFNKERGRGSWGASAGVGLTWRAERHPLKKRLDELYRPSFAKREIQKRPIRIHIVLLSLWVCGRHAK